MIYVPEKLAKEPALFTEEEVDRLVGHDFFRRQVLACINELTRLSAEHKRTRKTVDLIEHLLMLERSGIHKDDTIGNLHREWFDKTVCN